MNLDPYSGEVAERYRVPDVLSLLRDLRAWLESPSARTLSVGRNRHIRIQDLLGDGERDVMVKAFGERSWFHDARDRKRGSKACRTWLAAQHLHRHDVGTPTPIGYLER